MNTDIQLSDLQNIIVSDDFNSDLYAKCYPETLDYFYSVDCPISIKNRLYHHYLHHGQKKFYAKTDSLPIFYHIPKCGGTSIHHGLILPNLRHQYRQNLFHTLYDIHIKDPGKKTYMIDVICYSIDSLNINKLNSYTEISYDQTLDIRHIDISYDEFIAYLNNNIYILSIIINSTGFLNFQKYLDNILNQSSRQINKYIVLRNPISWHQSIFYYLRDVGKWEYTSSMFSKDMSFNDYVWSNLISDSWIIRNFTGLNDWQPITPIEFELCKNILNNFKHVGFLEKFQEFTTQLSSDYNWQVFDTVHLQYNVNNKSEYEEITPSEKQRLEEISYYDKMLYEYFFNKQYHK